MQPQSFLFLLGSSGIFADSCPDVSTITVLTSVAAYIPATTLLTLSSIFSTETDVGTITSAVTSTLTQTVSSNVTPTSYVFLSGGPPSSSSSTAAVSSSSLGKRLLSPSPLLGLGGCNADNCYRGLIRTPSVLAEVKSFCSIYTVIPNNPLPLPTFILPPCNAARVSSACSCVAPATATSSASSVDIASSLTTSETSVLTTVAVPIVSSTSSSSTSESSVSQPPTTIPLPSDSSTSSSSTSSSSTTETSAATTTVAQIDPSTSESSSDSAPTSTEVSSESSSAPSAATTTLPCTTLTSTVISTITIVLPSLAATSTLLDPLTSTTLATQLALTTIFTTTTTTLYPPAFTTTAYPCHNIQKYSGPTYGDATEGVDLQRQNFLYNLKTPEGKSTETCCNLCFFGLQNCVQAYWYSYQGCVVSQAFNTGAQTGMGVSNTCPGGVLSGLVYGNDAAPAYGTTGNIAGPCAQSYVNYWQPNQ